MTNGEPLAAPLLGVAPRSATFASLLRARGALVAVAALVAAILTVGAWPVGLLQDDGMYVILGKALAHGQGLRFLNLPGHPPATHFPPAYPALLAVLWKLFPSFPQNVAAFRFANAGLLGLIAFGTYRLARLALSESAATLTAVLATISVPALTLAGAVMSETMFMAVLVLALLLAERAVAREGVLLAVAAGVAAAGLALVRTIGVAALFALVLMLLVRRRWRDALLATVAGAVVLAPWMLWVARHAGDVPPVLVGKYGSYGAWLADGVRAGGVSYVLQVATVNLRDMAAVFAALVAPDRPAFVLAGLPIIGLLALGVGPVARRTPVTVATLAAYIGIVVLWPYEPHRFLWAVWPLLALLAVAGAVRVLAIPGRARPALRVALAALCVACAGRFGTQAVARDWDRMQRDGVARAAPLAEWVLANTRADDLIATDDELFVHLYTGRLTIPNGVQRPEDRVRPVSPDAALSAMRALLDTYHPAWLLAAYAPPVVAASTLTRVSPPRLRFTAALSNGAVFARTGATP